MLLRMRCQTVMVGERIFARLDPASIFGLWMGDDNQGLCPTERAIETCFERFRIERREALVENRELGALQQGASEENAASFTMRQLPTGFADGLHHA
jgi:hypothetical protein